MNPPDEVVEIFHSADAAAQGAPAAAVRELDATIRKLGGEIEELRQTNKTRADTIAQEVEDIGHLQNLLAGSKPGDELPSIGALGEVLPRGRHHELKRRQQTLERLREASVATERNIATKERELESLRALAAAPASSDRARTMGHLAKKATAAAARVQATGKEHGKALRELHAIEQAMAAAGDTDRARRAFSLAALQERVALAAVPAGWFEIDPNAAGLRGQQVFVRLDAIDATSPWRGRDFVEICDAHYAALIVETCRGR